MIAHLLIPPAGSDAKQETPAGKMVQGRHLSRQDDGVMLSHEADAGSQLQPRGHGRSRAQSREWVKQVGAITMDSVQKIAAGHGDVRGLDYEE